MKLKFFNQPYIYLIISVLVVSFIFIPTVNRDWQMFDEKEIFYNESLYPTPTSFCEIFEIISTYAFNFNIESNNLQFSNIINIRSNPVGAILNIFISYLFKKNASAYHLLSICFHILNTTLIWLIFHRLLSLKNISGSYNHLLSSLITLIWALHPMNIESILMATNWLCLLTYSFCFGLFLYNLLKLSNKDFTNSKFEYFIVFLSFFICILTGEYGYTLPFVIFFTSLAFSKSIRNSITLSMPYFSGLLFYVLLYLIKHFYSTNLSYQSTSFSLERFLWFSPQIFIHFLKIFFYPTNLSIYQSNLLSLAHSLLEPYAIFSSFIFISFLILPLIFFILFKAKGDHSFIFLLSYAFLFSIFPFLHILAPTYCIFAERYCYFPGFLFLFSIITFIPIFQNKKRIISLLFLILLPLSMRTIFRLQDWKDSYLLYSSATNTQKQSLYKGLGYGSLGYYFKSINRIDKANKYFSLCIKTLELEINKLKQKEEKQIPETLKIYGLDTNTQILNAAFRIASIRFYNFHENPLGILSFYESFVEKNINTAGSSQLDLYAKLLLETKNKKKALEVFKFAKEKYPFSTTIIFSLSNFYLNQKDLPNAEKIITEGLKYYPNYISILPRAIKLYWLKKDLPTLAKYEYLLGLRTHSKEAYKKSLEIYLFLNRSDESKRIIDKLNLMEKIKNEK